MDKKYILIIIVVIAGYFYLRKEEPVEEVTYTVDEFVFVDIKGEIEKPGVYRVSSETRIFEIIELAGGITNNASLNGINLSQKVEDEMIINVLEFEDKSHNYISINNASLTELMTLPKLGESKAQAIINYREKNGAFKKKEDVMLVTGIGEGIYASIEDFISIQ
ncbi:ComEA family DNA-binding protein [Mycoplasmatota bacterium WC44]